jgi:ATP-dependent Clp endopeptidase proteolytic subunit ClpP
MADAKTEKAHAEAIKFQAEAEALLITANAAAVGAEAKRVAAEAEAQKFLAEAAQAVTETRSAQLMVDKIEREERERLAGNRYHLTYVFSDAVNSGSVAACMTQFDIWHRTQPGCEVTLIFNCPGGGVIDGMALYDYLMQFRARGHKLNTVAMGYAASMAGILLQAGEDRQMGREAYILIHEVSFGVAGKIGEVEDEVKFVKMVQKRVLDIFADRAKVSRGYIAQRWRRKDWWLDSVTAQKLGIVDTVLGLPVKGKTRSG